MVSIGYCLETSLTNPCFAHGFASFPKTFFFRVGRVNGGWERGSSGYGMVLMAFTKGNQPKNYDSHPIPALSSNQCVSDVEYNTE